MSGYSGPQQRRFPAEPLRKALGCTSKSEVARKCGVDRAQMSRYFRDGVPEGSADQIAVRGGLHPGEVWPEWFEAVAS